jgi:hypothetical protein
MINEAIHILQHQKPDQHFVQTLMEASDQHPYASSLRVLLARASHLSGDARFDDDVRAAAIRTHNRKQLHDFVYAPLIEAKEMQPVLEETVEIVSEEESLSENIEVEKELVVDEVDETVVSETVQEYTSTEEVRKTEKPSETLSKEKTEESLEEEKPSKRFNLDQARIEVLEKQFLTEALASGAAIELLGEDSDESEAVNYAGNIRDRNKSATAQNKDTSSEDKQNTAEATAKKAAPEKLSLSGWLHLLETDDLAESTSEIETPSDPIEEDSPKLENKASVTSSPAESTEGTQSIKQAADIISNFIHNEDQIVPKRAEFFSPAKAAKNSLKDKDDLVTETLANIYAAQGNIEKAISTYEKLSLLHPEKSTYFAALIGKLKRQL